uniref:Uncharacterized protein n=1 Tax=viral metagenome TaxID=1070528 RepID=A0A6C0JH57_9ZZZZ
MSDKKINIDLNLFNLSKNKTRKKRTDDTNPDGIKIKKPPVKKKQDSLKKKSILKMIRQHQQDRYNNLFNEKKEVKVEEPVSAFNKDFEEAQKFMQNISEKTNAAAPKNTTIKNYSGTNSLLYKPMVDLFDEKNPVVPVREVTNTIVSNSLPNSNITLNSTFSNRLSPSPNYGCLKNGQLPTYRNYMNKTRKDLPNIPVLGGSTNVVPAAVPLNEASRNELIQRKMNESIKRVNEMKDVAVKLQQLKENTRPKKMKRKKTIRRTFKLGKSKVLPKVSVLVSNKTIRNNISTKSQLLKQTPIEEVKKHLIKQGLIKVGTIAPNDVLRKMYESSILMCGELTNHNSENLLYNYMNGGHS